MCIRDRSDTFPSALPGVQPCGENRKPGEKPGRDRRCKRVMSLSSAKAGHWGNLRRQRGKRGWHARTRQVRRPARETVYPSPRDRGGMVQPKEPRKKAAAVVMGCRSFCLGSGGWPMDLAAYRRKGSCVYETREKQRGQPAAGPGRSEEHTSELQSQR